MNLVYVDLEEFSLLFFDTFPPFSLRRAQGVGSSGVAGLALVGCETGFLLEFGAWKGLLVALQVCRRMFRVRLLALLLARR